MIIRHSPIRQRDLIFGVFLPVCPFEVLHDGAIHVDCRPVVLKLKVNAACFISCIGGVRRIGRGFFVERQRLLKLAVSSEDLRDVDFIKRCEHTGCKKASSLERYIVVLILAKQVPHGSDVVLQLRLLQACFTRGQILINLHSERLTRFARDHLVDHR